LAGATPITSVRPERGFLFSFSFFEDIGIAAAAQLLIAPAYPSPLDPSSSVGRFALARIVSGIRARLCRALDFSKNGRAVSWG
jgi:hypothetical protein